MRASKASLTIEKVVLAFVAMAILLVLAELSQGPGVLWFQLAMLLIVLVPIVAIPILILLAYLVCTRYDAFALILALRKGRQILNRDNVAQAEAYCHKALGRAEVLRFERDAALGAALTLLGEVRRLQGRLTEAEHVISQALRHISAADQRSGGDRIMALDTLLMIQEEMAIRTVTGVEE
jgi:hypothetical protein